MPVPDHIAPEMLEQLPDDAGVYYFLDHSGAIIYIGKSIHIKQRVLSHFYASSRDSKEKKLALATHAIRFTTTAGELSALLLESREVKQHNPLFNRRLRRHRSLYSWLLGEEDGRLLPRLVAAQWPPAPGEKLYGLYRSRSQANKLLNKLADTEQLCTTVLGLEPSTRGCFKLQLNRCRGACIGSESLASHNRRLLQALASHDELIWPYPGAIAIREQPAARLSVFDRYYFLGEVDNLEQTLALLTQPEPKLLDRDSYRILLHFLHKQAWQEKIMLIADEHSRTND